MEPAFGVTTAEGDRVVGCFLVWANPRKHAGFSVSSKVILLVWGILFSADWVMGSTGLSFSPQCRKTRKQHQGGRGSHKQELWGRQDGTRNMHRTKWKLLLWNQNARAVLCVSKAFPSDDGQHYSSVFQHSRKTFALILVVWKLAARSSLILVIFTYTCIKLHTFYKTL